jgi:hypothetical protein
LGAREEFYTRLIRIAELLGMEYVVTLRELFDSAWTEDSLFYVWPQPLIRALLMTPLAFGAPSDWVRSWLAQIEPLEFRGDELETELRGGVAQARAWLTLGDVVTARATWHRVLRATFGNGAKDDQQIACLKWAVRANRQDPVHASERLAQMAGAVLSLDGAEVQRYVADELLEAALAAGVEPARVLSEWMLQNGVKGWEETMTILVDGLATRAEAAAGVLSAFFRSLVLPFARSASISVVEHLGKALRNANESEELKKLAEAIEVVALGSTRPALRAALAGQSEDAVELVRPEGVTDPTALGQTVDAFDGLSLTLAELRVRAQSVADVEDLARRLKPGAYMYRWELVLAPLIGRATATELVQIASAIPENDYAWKVLAAISDRLLVLADPRVGPIIDRVVKSSRAAGWWSRYDGGSRLEGYELAVRLSPSTGRAEAWEALRRDIATGSTLPMAVFHSWDRVVDMLAPGIPAVDVWNVVARHVTALVASAPRGKPLVLPPAADSYDSAAVISEIYGLATAKLDHPALALAQGAQQVFTDRLLVADPFAADALTARLTDNGAPKDGALLVLRAISHLPGAISATVRAAIGKLDRAPQYPDRRAATTLLGTERERSEPVVSRPLPTVFELFHPPAPPQRRRPLLPRGAILPPAEDAADLVSAFRPELDLIAKWAHVQPEALYQFVADRAAAIAPTSGEPYGLNDEEMVRSDLSLIRLEVAYRRPRGR